jgi:hypothetical protein
VVKAIADALAVIESELSAKEAEVAQLKIARDALRGLPSSQSLPIGGASPAATPQALGVSAAVRQALVELGAAKGAEIVAHVLRNCPSARASSIRSILSAKGERNEHGQWVLKNGEPSKA